jgi:hypothetical protein
MVYTILPLFWKIVMLKKLFAGAIEIHRLSALFCASKTFMPTLSPVVCLPSKAQRPAGRVNQPFFAFRRLVSCLTLLLLTFDFSSQVLAQTQIVSCDAPVQSRKRGIAVNTMSAADFQVLAPGVSWFYDWGVNNWTVPTNAAMSYIPMVWNGSSSSQTLLSSYLAAGNQPWRVFAINEPNLTTQANMTPSNTAVAFKQVKAICDPYNIPVICPHMAEGTAANQSITAYDPIQGSNVTYTSEEPFLKAFFSYCSSNTPATPAGISDHSYAGYGDLTYWTGLMHSDFPTQTVWVTEFNPSNGGNPTAATVLLNLIQSVDYCERTPWIEGYSWFMSRITGDTNDSLLTTSSGVLTPAGQAYVQMPVHQTNLFYRIPGRLQAERYVTETSMNIAPTTDVDGLADMVSAASAGSVDYNIQVDVAGTYPMNFRVSGPVGQIRIYTNGTLIGLATSTQTGWSTVSATASVPLTAGAQTLHIVLLSSGQHLNWLEFLATNGTPSVPDNLTAAAGGTQVVLNWSASGGATNYNVKSSTTSGGTYTTIASPTTTSYTNTGLTTGVTYYYVVSAVNASGESSNSIQVSVTNTAPPVNLALHKVATVSSVESAGYPGTNAVDGNTGTRWSSAFSDPQWIYVDLLTNYNITEVDLNWENAYATSFQIQVSSDTTNWTTIYNTTTGPGGIQDLTGLSGTGRYVRMYGTVRATVYGYSLWEFAVYGTVPAPTNQPPVLSAIPNQSILAGRTLLVSNSATDPNVPPLPLTFSLFNPPAGASIDPNTGLFTWRPAIAQSPSTQTVAVVVSDNGTPVLSATQSFMATVNQPVNPVLNLVSISNGQFGFGINGDGGPDYTIIASTNLTSWNSVFTTNSPTLPCFWIDTNTLSYPNRYYRAVLGP